MTPDQKLAAVIAAIEATPVATEFRAAQAALRNAVARLPKTPEAVKARARAATVAYEDLFGPDYWAARDEVLAENAEIYAAHDANTQPYGAAEAFFDDAYGFEGD